MSQVPTNYFLFSVTMKIEGIRMFKDIPQEKFTELWVSFGVLNIFKFECVEDYLSYLGELQIEE